MNRLSLKGVHYAAFASEETSCFRATLCLDGEPVCEVSNEGRGGADHHYPTKGGDFSKLKECEAYAATQTYESPFTKQTEQHNLESLVGDLLMEWLIERDLKKALSSKWLYTRPDKPGVWQVPKKKVADPELWAQVMATKNSLPPVTFLHKLPFTEALAIYKAGAQ